MIKKIQPSYTTSLGSAYYCDSLELLKDLPDNSINLVITSPPFALLREKAYGNKNQDDYLMWLATFGELVYKKLKKDGSFVLDLGGSYQRGVPVRSLYNFRVLIHFCDVIGFHLAEDFYWNNPSKLPSPIEWVNKRKIRVKDSINTQWWFSKTEWPKANVKNVLNPYSERMKKLIMNPTDFYTPATRPSGHNISKSFSNDNGGAIPSNLLNISNSEATSQYLSMCKKIGIKGHPARFPEKIPEFFIKLLTEPGDVVVDIFSGSNTTGLVAEKLNRKWISVDNNLEYVASSILRFVPKTLVPEKILNIYNRIKNGKCIKLNQNS